MNHREQLQQFFRTYAAEKSIAGPVDPHDVAAWAYAKKLWAPRPIDVIDQLAEELSRAWREEYRTDRLGRRYRAKHAVKGLGPKQGTLWADIASAPRKHMEMAFAQRRQQVVGDCLQLKTDVDVFNDIRKSDEPINLVLDFTRDVEELQQPLKKTG